MQVKKIIHLFSDSLKSGKFFVIEQFRRLVSITAQFIALIEQRKEKNVVKMDLANFLTTELRGEIFLIYHAIRDLCTYYLTHHEILQNF